MPEQDNILAPDSASLEQRAYERGREFGAVELRISHVERRQDAIEVKLDSMAISSQAQLAAQTERLEKVIEDKTRPMVDYISTANVAAAQQQASQQTQERILKELAARKLSGLEARERWGLALMGLLSVIFGSIAYFLTTDWPALATDQRALWSIAMVVVVVADLMTMAVTFRRPKP